MAYCIYCGRKLEEGETCNCQDTQAGQNTSAGQNVQAAQSPSEGQNVQAVQGTSAGQNVQATQIPPQGNGQMYGQAQGGFQQSSPVNMQQYQENFNQAKEKSGIYLNKLLNEFLGVLKKPAECGKEFAASGDMTLGIGFFGVQAILSAIFALIICSKVNSLGKQAASSLIKEVPDVLSYPKAFLLTIIGSMVISFVTAGLLYLGVKLFQGKTTFGNMVCVAAVRSVGISVFLVLSIVIVYLNVLWGGAFFVLSWLVGLVYMIPLIQYAAEVNANQLTYIVIIAAILSIVVFYFWAKLALPMYASGEMKEKLEKMMDGLSNLNDLSSFF